MTQHMRRVMLGMLTALAVLPPASAALAEETAGKKLEMTFSVRKGTGDDPMVVVWIEKDTGDFVKTLKMFSKSKAYYKDMLGWLFKSRSKEKPADVDAVSGATIRWNKTGTLSVPVQSGALNLLDGSYVIRIESRKDKGNHYRNFKIPLPKDYQGGKHEDEGYVQYVEIAVKSGDSETGTNTVSTVEGKDKAKAK